MDCNNFYASCEKAFAPHLAARPVVVLSNNDGCIIARSKEAKDMGIPMGAPEFKHREAFKRLGVTVFSSNYALYGDMSARVMATAGTLVPEMEVYSIDEAFLNLTGISGAADHARRIRDTVHHWTGIPVSIGIGPTKTLAKAANRLAKKRPEFNGVLDLPEGQALEALLGSLDVEDVWGIGRKYGARLKARGVRSALDFMRLPRGFVLKSMTVGGLHTWLELHGTPCISLEQAPPDKKAIVSSRSFGRPVELLAELEEALAHYVSRAAEKLRAQKSVAQTILVFVQTNTFIASQPQYSAAHSLALHPPASSTPLLIRRGLEALRHIFRPGFRYKKVGVMLSGIEPAAGVQLTLFDQPDSRGDALMAALDRVNAKWGRGTLTPAAAGIQRPWSMRQNRRSPRYTTSWSELPVALAQENTPPQASQTRPEHARP